MTITMLFGSRKITHLPKDVRALLEEKLSAGHEFFIGDARGADKCFQKWLREKGCDRVKIFCSGSEPRVRLRQWQTICIPVSRSKKDFSFYTHKDQKMVSEADEGLCLWDEESKGTRRNVEQFLKDAKHVMVYSVKRKSFVDPEEFKKNIKSTRAKQAKQYELNM